MEKNGDTTYIELYNPSLTPTHIYGMSATMYTKSSMAEVLIKESPFLWFSFPPIVCSV